MRRLASFLLEFVIVCVLAFVTNAVVTYLWNLVRHGKGAIEWEGALFFAIFLGLFVTVWNRIWGSRRRN